MTELREGQFVQDGRAEAQITNISPDGMEVTIEYTDTHEEATLMRGRFTNRNGELRVS